MNMQLKYVLIKNWKEKLFFSILATFIFCICYPLLARKPIFVPMAAPILYLDKKIPFLPGTIYPYESIWFFNASVIWLLASNKEIKKYSLGVIALMGTAFLCFLFFPVSVTLPLSFEGVPVLYKFLRRYDTSLNALPSMHAAFVVFHFLWYLSLFSKKRISLFTTTVFFIWGCIIIISTLTLKQHVIVDIATGTILAIIVFHIFSISHINENFLMNMIFPKLLQSGVIGNKLYVVNNICVNFFIMKTDGGKFVCFDSGWHSKTTMNALENLKINPDKVVAVFLTHKHWDHAAGTKIFRNAEIYNPDSVNNKNCILYDNMKIEIFHIPGHTDDSTAYFVNKQYLFTGDAIRIKDNTIFPFYTIFNKNNKQALLSAKNIHKLEPRLILTAHSGILRT